MSDEISSAAARVAAARFDVDRGAASCRQLGRPGGFTNRRHRHERADGSQLFTLLREASGVIDPAAQILLAAARAELATRPTLAVGSASSPPPVTSRFRRRRLRLTSPEGEYGEARRRVLSTLAPGTVLNRSRLNYAIAARLLDRGASEGYVAAVVAAGDRVAAMPSGPGAAYVAQSLAAAMRSVRF